jgi:hypothetical protein
MGHNFHVEWHLRFGVEMCEKPRSTSPGTIHLRPKNSDLGMPFVHNWLRKRTYTPCISCRGIGDLQLCYSPLGPLLLKNLEQNAVEQGQVDFFKSAASRVRAHARRHARDHASPHRRPTGHNRRCTAATASPTVPHRRPHPNPRCHTSHIHRLSKPTLPPPNQRPHRRTRPAPAHVAASPIARGTTTMGFVCTKSSSTPIRIPEPSPCAHMSPRRRLCLLQRYH